MLTTLINSIPATDDPVPVFPSLQIGFEERGDKQHQVLIAEPERPSPVTGLFALITYLDARGFIASRRTTMKRPSLHWNVPTLFVWCHEVNGIRLLRPVREDFKQALEILLGGPFNHRLRLKGGRKDNFFYSALAVIDADQGIQDSALQFIYELKAHA